MKKKRYLLAYTCEKIENFKYYLWQKLKFRCQIYNWEIVQVLYVIKTLININETPIKKYWWNYHKSPHGVKMNIKTSSFKPGTSSGCRKTLLPWHLAYKHKCIYCKGHFCFVSIPNHFFIAYILSNLLRLQIFFIFIFDRCC